MKENDQDTEVLLLVPFYTDSHKAWVDGLIAHSRYRIKKLTLPGRHWKWRMHGAAVTFAQNIKKISQIPNLIITTDMLDVATLKALIPAWWQQIPIWLYMHENQLTYPWSATDPDPTLQRDRHYAWINYTSSLLADHISFNSDYHLNSFLGSLPTYLAAFPDYQHIELVQSIKDKSDVLPLGLNFPDHIDKKIPGQKPHILWNHRWEYDKNPDLFFHTLYDLSDSGIAFDLSVVGRSYGRQPAIFAQAKEKLARHIQWWGYQKDKSTYEEVLRSASVLPITSNQDFFGISVVEAIRYGLVPILPNRLAYPDYIDPYKFPILYYNNADQFTRNIKDLCARWPHKHQDLSAEVYQFSWQNMISKYDSKIQKISLR